MIKYDQLFLLLHKKRNLSETQKKIVLGTYL